MAKKLPGVFFVLDARQLRDNDMTTQLTSFDFNTLTVRVIEHKGQPWFVAADVCKALGIQKPSMAVKPLDESEKRKSDLPLGRGSAPTLISESGLYKLIMRSDKPEARTFQDWVTQVVLPAIRQDGMYVMGEEKVATGEMSEDEMVFKAMHLLQGKVERLQQELQELTDERNGLAKVLGCRQHTVGQFARNLTGVNTHRVKWDLMIMKYFYRKYGAYRVYAQYHHLFQEKLNEQTGYSAIMVTEKGKVLMARLYEQGDLTMKKAWR